MNRRQVSLHVLCMAAMLLILSACSRNDVLDCSHESMREFEAHVKWEVDQIKERVDLRPLSVQASVSNAFEKARKRKKCGANYGVVPVYCSIGEDDFRRDQDTDSHKGFRIDIENFGTRVSWDDLDQIWLMIVLPSRSDGRCEVIESSLWNIKHGMGSSWSMYEFGDFWCRCNDPRLGWGEESLSWHTIVAEGSCKLFLLMDSGKAWGRKHGRKFYGQSAFENNLQRLKDLGVVVELVPIAYSKKKCFLECR